jgi:hypothetical protein
MGEGVFGFGIPNPATIVSVDSPTQITISAPATQTTTANFIALSSSYQLTGCLGDDPSTLLSSRKILVGDLINSNTYIYDAALNAWSPSGTKVYPDSSDEEGWARISDGTIITYDLFHSIHTNGSYAEKYHPKTGMWTGISPSDGTANGTIPQLSSRALGEELGPLLRLQDGRILAIGATQHTALYNPATNTWAAGPDISGMLNGIPSPFGADDAPGAILPNGHVIFAADAGVSGFTSSGNINFWLRRYYRHSLHGHLAGFLEREWRGNPGWVLYRECGFAHPSNDQQSGHSYDQRGYHQLGRHIQQSHGTL